MDNNIHCIAFVGNYLPRRCGIATFTADLCEAVAGTLPEISCLAVPMNDREAGYDYPAPVRFEVDEDELAAYRRAANFLNLHGADIVSLQHEFGIFGGPAGAHILELLRQLRMPIVTTLHTILPEPTEAQREVMGGLRELSDRFVVMSERGHQFLREVYRVPAGMIDIIPHGIHDVPFIDPNYYKDQFGVEGRKVLLTFGLLGPSKGIETAIDALPTIVEGCPEVTYIILGATHPNLIRESGESYRESLLQRAEELGVAGHVKFFNKFVGTKELMEFIGAADVYLTPYPNEAQITSGTLAYSVGAGKAVVSTPYWHAQELLADGRGVLVPFGDPEAIAGAVVELLGDEVKRTAIRKAAYTAGRQMIWSRVAEMYVNSFTRARASRVIGGARKQKLRKQDAKLELPEVKLDHLYLLSDDTGMLQHATFNIANYAEGYCVDDNARALILAIYGQQLGLDDARLRRCTSRYLAFLEYAYNREMQQFRNFMSFDRRWLESTGSEDSHARAIWALGTVLGRDEDPRHRHIAGNLFNNAVRTVERFTTVRGWAFALIGIHEYFRNFYGDYALDKLRRRLAHRMVDAFKHYSRPDWPWFENSVTYSNARLSHAMLLCGHWLMDEEMMDIGLHSLEWLCGVQTGPDGCFAAVGNDGFYRRGQEMPRFDQQPVEANSTVSACLEAYRVTREQKWLNEAHRAFAWFLGANDLGLPLYDAETGGCRDGLRQDRLNQNQGAESTLAYLLSLTELKLFEQTESPPSPAPDPLTGKAAPSHDSQ